MEFTGKLKKMDIRHFKRFVGEGKAGSMSMSCDASERHLTSAIDLFKAVNFCQSSLDFRRRTCIYFQIGIPSLYIKYVCKRTENGERGTGNGERGTGNGERGTGSGSGERGTEV